MNIVTKVVAWMEAMQPADIEAMPPAQRRRFADLCAHWHRIAERPSVDGPKTGVLAALRDGRLD